MSFEIIHSIHKFNEWCLIQGIEHCPLESHDTTLIIFLERLYSTMYMEFILTVCFMCCNNHCDIPVKTKFVLSLFRAPDVTSGFFYVIRVAQSLYFRVVIRRLLVVSLCYLL